VIASAGFRKTLLAALVPALVLAMVCAETATAQTPPAANDPAPNGTAQVSFHQDRVGLPVPHFTITVQEDGRGAYHGELATTTPAAGRPQTGDAYPSRLRLSTVPSPSLPERPPASSSWPGPPTISGWSVRPR
jgi:hypothetical protein